jgi:hypothetical protein
MLITKQLQKRWKNCKDRGDVKLLAEQLGYTTSSPLSRILAGKEHTTTAKLVKIKKFIEKKESVIADI